MFFGDLLLRSLVRDKIRVSPRRGMISVFTTLTDRPSVVGDEPVVVIDISGMAEYAKRA